MIRPAFPPLFFSSLSFRRKREMYSFQIATLLVLTFARFSYCITFVSLPENDTSTSVVFSWTRNATDEPALWALAPVFTFDTAAPPIFEFQFVRDSNETSGTLMVPVQTSVNLTLLTFAYQFDPKKGFVLELNFFGKPTTFEVSVSNGSRPHISPGILPPPLKSMLKQAHTTTTKTPIIVGSVVGSVVFLLLLLVVVLLLRRRRAHNRAALLRIEHQQYRTTPPNFTSFPRFSAASDGSKPWSVTSAQALPAHPAISHALSVRAAAATRKFSRSPKIPISFCYNIRFQNCFGASARRRESDTAAAG